MTPFDVLSTLFVLVATLYFNDFLYMARYPFNPSLYSALREVFPLLWPPLRRFRTAFRDSFLCSHSFHPEPSWFNSIKIRRVTAPKEAFNVLIDCSLYGVYVRRSLSSCTIVLGRSLNTLGQKVRALEVVHNVDTSTNRYLLLILVQAYRVADPIVMTAMTCIPICYI